MEEKKKPQHMEFCIYGLAMLLSEAGVGGQVQADSTLRPGRWSGAQTPPDPTPLPFQSSLRTILNQTLGHLQAHVNIMTAPFFNFFLSAEIMVQSQAGGRRTMPSAWLAAFIISLLFNY